MWVFIHICLIIIIIIAYYNALHLVHPLCNYTLISYNIGYTSFRHYTAITISFIYNIGLPGDDSVNAKTALSVSHYNIINNLEKQYMEWRLLYSFYSP